MNISFIWAMSRDGVIGKDNKLPWRLPADLAFFKEQTLGKTIVMGRKTWDSIGRKPLPKRRNIVLTKDLDFEAPGAEIVHSLDQIAHLDEVMVIGGAGVFAQMYPLANKLIVTHIDDNFEGDVYFPTIDWDHFREVSSSKGPKDERNPYDYRFVIYERFKAVAQ
ncbi:dihydrofolate reductase [Paenibacillus shirakamiensis]|uniref:Dihydrofolate reductase n=1 Tax=Paenibacillus shirakamiensis TaxID=1265935 RepID=A0ABS4JDN2_9BACL|nr:dihydrofolate reductase [Paenibacillus shirakamiensis]MBP1999823.1 dihydrofolate reductase [Paenibacillus shirakamiensis]